MTAMPAGQRLRRLLAILPWLAEAGDVSVAEIADRFGMTPAQVVSDLELAACCGLPPYSPDELFEIIVDDDLVSARFTRLFHRRQAFSNSEAIAVLASGNAMLALGEGDQLTNLASALAKVSAALGDVDFGVDLGVDADQARALNVIRDAVDRRVCVHIDYQSAWRDDVSRRVIEPTGLTMTDGKWYVSAWCRSSVGWRTFRIDRIMNAELVEEQQPRREARSDTDSKHDGSAITAVISFPAHLSEAISHMNGAGIVVGTGATRTAPIEVTNTEWLGAMLCRFGGEITVLEPTEWVDLGPQTATRMLARYLRPKP